MQVEPDVDPFVLEALDPVVEPVHHLGVEVLRVLAVLVDHRAADPAHRVVMVDAHQVVSELGDAPGLGLDLLLVGEDGVGGDVSAPEAGLVPSPKTSRSPSARTKPSLPAGLWFRKLRSTGLASCRIAPAVPVGRVGRAVALGQRLGHPAALRAA